MWWQTRPKGLGYEGAVFLGPGQELGWMGWCTPDSGGVRKWHRCEGVADWLKIKTPTEYGILWTMPSQSIMAFCVSLQGHVCKLLQVLNLKGMIWIDMMFSFQSASSTFFNWCSNHLISNQHFDMTKPKGFRIHNYNNNYTFIVVSYGSLRLICLKRTRRRLVWAFFGWKVAQFWTLIFQRRGACSTRCPEVIRGTVDDRNCGGDVWNCILAIYVQLKQYFVIYQANRYSICDTHDELYVLSTDAKCYLSIPTFFCSFGDVWYHLRKLDWQRSPDSRDLGNLKPASL